MYKAGAVRGAGPWVGTEQGLANGTWSREEHETATMGLAHVRDARAACRATGGSVATRTVCACV